MRILLVEDNDAVRKAFKDTLELLSYDVYEAEDGLAALSLIQSLANKFDLIISDLVMPNMNALQLYEALEEVQEDVRMLIVTGYPMPGAGELLAERPGVDWTYKPIDVHDLMELVTELTGE